MAVRLAQGMELRDAAREANCAGAYTCMHLGVIGGLPTLDELQSLKDSFPSSPTPLGVETVLNHSPGGST